MSNMPPLRDLPSPHSPVPSIRELSNGRYQVRLSTAGSGQSLWTWMALSRCAGDPVEDADGFFVYLRDVESGAQWSAGWQPTGAVPQTYRVACAPGKIVIQRCDADIETEMEVAVSPKDDLEVRRVRLHNASDRTRRIELTSYVEVALTHPMTDRDHPAFSKLFVQTEWHSECGALVAMRRPRSRDESWPALFHFMSGAAPEEWETDRLQFLGRGRTMARPAALLPGSRLSGTTGNVLDPVLSLRTFVELAPGERRDVSLFLGVLENHNAVPALVKRYGEPADIEKLFQDADAEALRTTADESPPDAGEDISPPPVPQAASCSAPKIEAQAPTEALRFFNGFGGFSEDGSEYVIRLPWRDGAPLWPPLPWINVIANENFGFLVSESGAGGTWSRNSQANRLTPWSNDPVCDPHGEAFFIRDDDSGEFWSPLPGPAPAPVAHEVRHGFGCTRFNSTAHELEQEATFFVARHDPVKIVRLRLTNRGEKTRRLSVFGYQRLVLGSLPESPNAIRTWQDGATLCAGNAKAGDFRGGIAFTFAVISGAQAEAEHVSCDRRSFVGRNGSIRAPKAVCSSEPLDGACGTALDHCFARQIQVTLSPSQTVEYSFVLGEAMGESALQTLVARYREPAALDSALEEVTSFWRGNLGTIRVETPVPEIDLMVNGWLAYQALSCRIWGRTAFYQSSGAYGFRDQLQDVAGVLPLWPELARKQILLHTRHQFVEGDVLHWWHPAPMERGMRTRFSDDLLWLPYVTARYVNHTGDVTLLDEHVSFLHAPLLEPGQDEAYLQPEITKDTAAVYEHCCRALDRSLTRGAHGLPLMGTGDWNDGMNRVGREGRGESVWLGFFLYYLLGDFIPLAQRRGETMRAERYADYRLKLVTALNEAGWDGSWYRRAYYDDGTPLGTKDGDECRIDGLAQSWSVISGAAPADRAAQAMDAAEAQLISEEDGIIRLLTPPFVNTAEDPGYIKGYVAGVRENGGQYTHAACWVVRAMAELGRRNQAARLLAMLSPVSHTRTPGEVERYKVEPYVIAADIYGAQPHVGRGGWTWYTGSAAWMYRVALESVLGFRIEDGKTLVLRPCIPDEWARYRIDYRDRETGAVYHITIENPHRSASRIVHAEADGDAMEFTHGEARMPLARDARSREIVITMG